MGFFIYLFSFFSFQTNVWSVRDYCVANIIHARYWIDNFYRKTTIWYYVYLCFVLNRVFFNAMLDCDRGRPLPIAHTPQTNSILPIFDRWSLGLLCFLSFFYMHSHKSVNKRRPIVHTNGPNGKIPHFFLPLSLLTFHIISHILPFRPSSLLSFLTISFSSA